MVTVSLCHNMPSELKVAITFQCDCRSHHACKARQGIVAATQSVASIILAVTGRYNRYEAKSTLAIRHQNFVPAYAVLSAWTDLFPIVLE